MGNGYTTTLPLEVFTERNFMGDFIRLKLNFIFKKTKETIWGLRSNTRSIYSSLGSP